MPSAPPLRTYFRDGDVLYAQHNVVANQEYRSVVPHPGALLHCSTLVRQKMLPGCRHLRRKQQFLAVTWIEDGAELVRSDATVILAQAGDVVLMQPGCDVEFALPEHGSCRKTGIVVEGRALGGILESGGLCGCLCRSGIAPEWLRDFFERMRDALPDAERNGALCFELLQRLASSGEKEEPEALRTVRLYVDRHIGDDLSLPLLARLAGVSVSQLGKLARQYWEVPVHRFVRTRRLTLARQLLVGGALSVKETAYRVGYPNVFNFSTEFRKFHGLSPGQISAGK